MRILLQDQDVEIILRRSVVTEDSLMHLLDDPFETGRGSLPWIPVLRQPSHMETELAQRWETAHNEVRERFAQFCYHMGRYWRWQRKHNQRCANYEYYAALVCLYSITEQVLQELNVFFQLGYDTKKVLWKNKKFYGNLHDVFPSGTDHLQKVIDSKWLSQLYDERHEFVHREPSPKVEIGILKWGNGQTSVLVPRQPEWESEFIDLYIVEMKRFDDPRWCRLRSSHELMHALLKSVWGEMWERDKTL